MARTPTTNHGFSQAGSSLDLFDYTEDHVNLLNRLDAALAGLAAFNAGVNEVNSDAANAGKLLSSVAGGSSGRVIGKSGGDDATLVFQDNPGSGNGSDKATLGYHDDGDGFAVNIGGALDATFGNNDFRIDAGGNGVFANALNVDGDLTAGDGSSDVFHAQGHLEHRSARKQSFQIWITNTAGTIQHRITGRGSAAVAGDFHDKVNGASTSYVNTPSVDAVTGFAAGGGVLAGSEHLFLLDVAAQGGSTSIGQAQFRGNAMIERDDTGSSLTVITSLASRDINGVSDVRNEFQIRSNGLNFALNATNIAAGEIIRIVFDGYLV